MPPVAGPSPRPCPRFTADEAPRVRRLDCRRASDCLAIAEARSWTAFTCAECAAYLAPTEQERLIDEAGLLSLAYAVEKQHHADQEESRQLALTDSEA